MKKNSIKTKKLRLSFAIFATIIFFTVSLLAINRQINGVKRIFQQSLMQNSIKSVNLKTEALFRPISKNLATIAKWGQNRLFSIDEKDKTIKLISPVIIENSKINHITIYSSKGLICRIKRSSDNSPPIQNLTPSETIADSTIVFEQYTLKDSINRSAIAIFSAIIEKNEKTGWFFNKYLEDKPLTATIKWSLDSITYAAFIETNISTISTAIAEQLPTDSSHFFFSDRAGESVVFSKYDSFQFYDKFSSLPIELSEFIAIIKENSSSALQLIDISNNNGTFVGITDTINSNDHFFFGIVTPQSELDRMIGNKRVIWYTVLGVLIILFILLILLMLRSYYQVIALEKHTEIKSIDNPIKLKELIGLGESDTLEFKSTVRYNIHTKKNGREIEMAWLKNIAAFLNTNGGVILLGVTDDGDIFGLKNDAFANDDKCLLHINSLIKRHIGAEFINEIDVVIITIEEKQVVVLTVSPTTTPAYLKDGNNENFYIRTGPSAAKLNVAEAISYISKRDK